jgi:hypothetical protein
LKSFPSSFNEPFNVKFDHAQHNTGSARPQRGCAGCHNSAINRGAGLSIPANIAAHNNCYTCHTPSSKSTAGREIAIVWGLPRSESVPADEHYGAFVRFASVMRITTRASDFACADCHKLTAPRHRRDRSVHPRQADHFATTRGQTCLTCHNGKRSFGGDLAFKDCKRCHSGPTFRMRSEPRRKKLTA